MKRNWKFYHDFFFISFSFTNTEKLLDIRIITLYFAYKKPPEPVWFRILKAESLMEGLKEEIASLLEHLFHIHFSLVMDIFCLNF